MLTILLIMAGLAVIAILVAGIYFTGSQKRSNRKPNSLGNAPHTGRASGED